MKILFSILVAVLLAACAAQPANNLAGNAVQDKVHGPIVVAMLAPLNSYEWRAAPTFTRLIVLRRTAAAKLYRGEISAGTATQILHLSDQARAKLDAGVIADAKKDAETATLAIQAAEQSIESGQRLLEQKP